MVGVLRLNHIVHGVPYRTGALFVHEVAHVDGTAVNEFPFEVFNFHQTPEQPRVLVFVSPVAPTRVIVGVIEPLNVVEVGILVI